MLQTFAVRRSQRPPSRCRQPLRQPRLQYLQHLLRRCPQSRTWAMFVWVPAFLTACAAPPAPPSFRPSPPPANLAQLCDPGPNYPQLSAGETISFVDFLDIAQAREEEALRCRIRHRDLVEAWPK